MSTIVNPANIFKTSNEQETQQIQTTISTTLLTTCRSPDVETRVTAMRALTLIINALPFQPARSHDFEIELLEAVREALNDYTINERGDIGSLVRTEALAVVEFIWQTDTCADSPQRTTLELAVRRLALERLDKLRLRAAICLSLIHI